MATHKDHTSPIRTGMAQTKEDSVFKRYAIVLESIIFLVVITSLLYATRFIDTESIITGLLNTEDYGQLAKLTAFICITMLGTIALLFRFNFTLSKQLKKQNIASGEIRELAFYDQLTNLPNQALCHDRLDHAIAQASRNKTSVGVLYVTIDDFKAVNTQQGHDAGDKLLQEVAKRLTRELRPGDTLARINGVEFIIILESLSPQENVHNIVKNILNKLVKFYSIEMQEIYITSNIGVATYPYDGEHGKELIKNADKAVRFAQEQGKNSIAFFSAEIQEQVNTKKKIAEQLSNALTKNELELHYQPIVSTETHKIIGAEALLRWNNKVLGEMAPDVFIPIAEDIGLINEIGDWVLTKACQQNKAWQDQGLAKIVMSINLSVMQLGLHDYAETVATSLDATHLESQYLELEITEDIIMKDVKQSMLQLRLLGALDVTVALDDFGTGYSSMKYLPKLGLSKLKIDRRFTKGLTNNELDVKAVLAITALAQQLDLKVTAEGVETAEQCKFIERCNIDAMQGYYFSKAVTAEDFTELLATPSWHESKTA
ncbi:bifunctional diguanylate cyclase/phosphodiesterase [Colwellia sp. E2M01]|uniref:putative bifunctional diguanylate cyclase/phosphodiesterase n=1 Tax=Colwellia sp. E2M01 TaxID=2841561 RepID=UPI001C091AB0|nr:bifunctional diguanylate cyclase/phosphodiesterase [Colwellia sp. E2M01]MBU2870024.1 bifunctional diguanylate cyclase/phosphodiesterase [Colwellia sp. E2M01]